MGLALQVTISFGYRHNFGSLNKGLMICSCKNLIVHEQEKPQLTAGRCCLILRW